VIMGWVQIEGANLPGVRLARFSDTSTAAQRYFVGSTSPINAVKVFPSSGGKPDGRKDLLLRQRLMGWRLRVCVTRDRAHPPISNNGVEHAHGIPALVADA
jgi:hypothetical protein